MKSVCMEDLSKELRKYGFSVRKSRRAIRAIFDALTEALLRGEEVDAHVVSLKIQPSGRKPKTFQMNNGVDLQGRPVGPRMNYRKEEQIVSSTALLAFFDDHVEKIRVNRSNRVPCDGA